MNTNRSAQVLLIRALESGLTKFSLKAADTKFALSESDSFVSYNYNRVDGQFAELSIAVQTKGATWQTYLR